ncbi:MAG: hypothetical protein ACOX43_03255 [Bacilli bacterium]|jgi:hypothetical protein
MRKLIYIFLLVCFLIFGMKVGSPEPKSESDLIHEKIEEFEKEIEKPNNQYQPKSKENINPNLSNNLAKQGENIINKGFDFLLDTINSLIQNGA